MLGPVLAAWMRRVDELEEKLAASEETAHGLELELCQAKAEAARSTATAEEMRAVQWVASEMALRSKRLARSPEGQGVLLTVG